MGEASDSDIACIGGFVRTAHCARSFKLSERDRASDGSVETGLRSFLLVELEHDPNLMLSLQYSDNLVRFLAFVFVEQLSAVGSGSGGFGSMRNRFLESSSVSSM